MDERQKYGAKMNKKVRYFKIAFEKNSAKFKDMKAGIFGYNLKIHAKGEADA